MTVLPEPTSRPHWKRRFLWALAVAGFTPVPPLSAQNVLSPGPAPVRRQPKPMDQFQIGETTEAEGAQRQSQGPEQRSSQSWEQPRFNPDRWLTWGPISVRPSASYQVSYSDHLLQNAGRGGATFLNTLTPGVSFDIGRYLTLDYSPNIRFYSNKAYRNSVDHNVAFSGVYPMRKWLFGLSQTYNQTSDPLIETGGQADQQSYGTRLLANYAHSIKTHVELSLQQQIRDVQRFSGDKEWSTEDWFDYAVLPKTSVALGAGFGYAEPDRTVNMTYERPLARVRYRVTSKVNVELHGGVEIRQFEGHGIPDRLNPIFGFTASYQPWEPTSISFSADRTVQSSYFAGQINETTGFRTDVRQRFFQKYYLGVGGEYRTEDYRQTTSQANLARSDKWWDLDVSLSRTFLRRGTGSIFYRYITNTSTSGCYAFASNQIGLQVGYRF